MVYSADQNQAVTLALSTKLWPISLIVSYLTPPFTRAFVWPGQSSWNSQRSTILCPSSRHPAASKFALKGLCFSSIIMFQGKYTYLSSIPEKFLSCSVNRQNLTPTSFPCLSRKFLTNGKEEVPNGTSRISLLVFILALSKCMMVGWIGYDRTFPFLNNNMIHSSHLPWLLVFFSRR